MAVCWSPVGELHVLREFVDLRIRHDDELLVSGRVYPEVVALVLEDLFHLHGHVDGVAGKLEIKLVREQSLKLQTYECALGYDGAMLFLNAEEMLVGRAIGKDNGFSAIFVPPM